jgi:aminopeptidase N
MGLVGEQGNLAFSLRCEQSQQRSATEALLRLTEAVETCIFEGVAEQPIPALLRSFSAPVRLKKDLSVEGLRRLITAESDGFIR